MNEITKDASRILAAILLTIAQPAYCWTLDYDFENQSPGERCGNWDSAGNSKVVSSLGFMGSLGCKLSISEGQEGFGLWGGIFRHPAPLVRGDEIWIRVRTYIPKGFDYDVVPTAGAKLKFLRIHTGNPDGTNIGYNDWYLVSRAYDPPFGFIYEGELKWHMFGATDDRIKFDQWETFEYYVKLDTVPAYQGGQGRVRAWKDGRLIADITDRQTLKTADARSGRTHLFTYWNGSAPKTQEMFVDDIIVTTDRPNAADTAGNPYIGTSYNVTAPAPPTMINVR